MRLILFILILFSFTCGSAPNKERKTEQKTLSELLRLTSLSNSPVHIFIDKSDYLLHLVQEMDTLKTYSVALGTNPIDPKICEGDRCTPEGAFKIRAMYPHQNWKKFIWIDYPNDQSRENFQQAVVSGEIPAESKIGGEIGIHGTPEGRQDLIDERVNWTYGCISVTRRDVDEIYSLIDLNSIVTITQ